MEGWLKTFAQHCMLKELNRIKTKGFVLFYRNMCATFVAVLSGRNIHFILCLGTDPKVC